MTEEEEAEEEVREGTSVILPTCHYCGEPLETASLAHEVIGDIIYRRHRVPCYSEEVPL